MRSVSVVAAYGRLDASENELSDEVTIFRWLILILNDVRFSFPDSWKLWHIWVLTYPGSQDFDHYFSP